VGEAGVDVPTARPYLVNVIVVIGVILTVPHSSMSCIRYQAIRADHVRNSPGRPVSLHQPRFRHGKNRKRVLRKRKKSGWWYFCKLGSINKCGTYVFNLTLKPPSELRFTVLGHPKTRTRIATTSDQ
jgi:hypothetical protein